MGAAHVGSVQRAIVALLLLIAAPATAQRPTPDVRADLDVGAFGFGYSTDAANVTFSFAGAVRIVHRSGHGVRIAGGYGDEIHADDGILRAHAAHVSIGFIDVAYTLRLRFEGDDRRGGALDLFAGPSYGFIDNQQADAAFCLCSTPRPYPDRTFADRPGDHVGAVLGFSIDGRIDHFVAGVDVSYRGLVALGSAPGRGDTHSLIAAVHIGVGLY
jgi:hypothetical protein